MLLYFIVVIYLEICRTVKQFIIIIIIIISTSTNFSQQTPYRNSPTRP